MTYDRAFIDSLKGDVDALTAPEQFNPQPAPYQPSPAYLAALRQKARERVESALTGLWKATGGMGRDELGALMDGAQEAVMEWLPPAKEGA